MTSQCDVLKTSPEALRAFELDYPMFQGYGDYLRRQGKLELIPEPKNQVNKNE